MMGEKYFFPIGIFRDVVFSCQIANNSWLPINWKLLRCLVMYEREKIIRLWFSMWLTQQDFGIDDIFAEDVVYIESWGPKYDNRKTVKHWFDEWNTRGKVISWDIKQFIHKDNQTVVVWYFKNEMYNGKIEEFDGISMIEWAADNKIKLLKEFGCNRNNYNPYENGDKRQFRDEKASWF